MVSSMAHVKSCADLKTGDLCTSHAVNFSHFGEFSKAFTKSCHGEHSARRKSDWNQNECGKGCTAQRNNTRSKRFFLLLLLVILTGWLDVSHRQQPTWVNIHRKNASHDGTSQQALHSADNWGYPIAGWLISMGKSHLEMDDNWGYPYFRHLRTKWSTSGSSSTAARSTEIVFHGSLLWPAGSRLHRALGKLVD